LPREKVLAVLQEALAQSSADTSELVERLASGWAPARDAALREQA